MLQNKNKTISDTIIHKLLQVAAYELEEKVVDKETRQKMVANRLKVIFKVDYKDFVVTEQGSHNNLWEKYYAILYSVVQNNKDMETYKDNSLLEDGTLDTQISQITAKPNLFPAVLRAALDTDDSTRKNNLLDVARILSHGKEEPVKMAKIYAMNEEYKKFAAETPLEGLSPVDEVIQRMFSCTQALRPKMKRAQNYFDQTVESFMGRRVSLSDLNEKAVKRLTFRYKYYYAGCSARWFFDYEVEQIKSKVARSINDGKITEVKNCDDIQRLPHTLRVEFARYRVGDPNSNGVKIGLTSAYVAKCLADHFPNGLFSDTYRKMALELKDNPGCVGVLYEKIFFATLREMRTADTNHLNVMYLGTYPEISMQAFQNITKKFPVGQGVLNADNVGHALATNNSLWIRPKKVNYATLDGVIRVDDHLLVVQITRNRQVHTFDFNVIDKILTEMEHNNAFIKKIEVAFLFPTREVAGSIRLDVSGLLRNCTYSVVKGREVTTDEKWPKDATSYIRFISMYHFDAHIDP